MDDLKLKDNDKPSGPVQVGNLKVYVDRDLCIGAATCLAVAIKTFGLDAEAKAVILDSAGEESAETVVEAARACPTAAIIIEDENGKRVFPV